MAAADLERATYWMRIDSSLFGGKSSGAARRVPKRSSIAVWRGRFGKEDVGVLLLQQVLANNPSQEVARRIHEGNGLGARTDGTI
jgi:hypothetical protein